jgi:hypothetical protein
MLTATANSRPSSRLRLLTLLAAAHASLALYLWLCAFDVNLIIIPVRLWEVLTWSWVGWPVLLLVRYRRLVARPVDWAWGLVNGPSLSTMPRENRLSTVVPVCGS